VNYCYLNKANQMQNPRIFSDPDLHSLQ